MGKTTKEDTSGTWDELAIKKTAEGGNAALGGLSDALASPSQQPAAVPACPKPVKAARGRRSPVNGPSGPWRRTQPRQSYAEGGSSEELMATRPWRVRSGGRSGVRAWCDMRWATSKQTAHLPMGLHAHASPVRADGVDAPHITISHLHTPDRLRNVHARTCFLRAFGGN